MCIVQAKAGFWNTGLENYAFEQGCQIVYLHTQKIQFG
jgi:hypothetical protein